MGILAHRRLPPLEDGHSDRGNHPTLLSSAQDFPGCRPPSRHAIEGTILNGFGDMVGLQLGLPI